jgi:hypothetical protein
MSRYEYFAGLFIVGCVNGLGSRVIGSVRLLGWTDALIATFGISVIVWVACYQGIRLILQEKTDNILPADLVLGVLLLVPMSLPIGGLSWLAVTVLSLYVILAGSPSSAQRRGAIILLATTVPMLWSRVLFRYFANFILDIDASLIGLLLGTRNTGNIVPFKDGSGSLMILPFCSSMANVSLAFLAWVTVTNWLPHRWSPRDLYWCLLAGASVIAVNVTRIGLMGLSQENYRTIHSPLGDTITNQVLLGLTVGICLLGVRRDPFIRT